MDFEITYAKTNDDLLEIADMMGKVFASRSYFDFYTNRMALQTKDPFYKPEYSRIIKSQGKIVSHVSIVEKHMRIGTSVVRVAGIGDVFTHPDFRKHNFTRLLMEDAIKYMGENKFPVSMLYGIMNFYHKFGYIESVLNPSLTVPIKNISSLYTEKLVRPFKIEDIPILNKLYNKQFEGKTLSVKRVDKSWYNFPIPNTCFVVADNKDIPIAYFILSAPPSPKTLSFYVKESVVFDKDSAAAITVFLRDQLLSIYQNEIELRQRPDTFFAEFINDFGGTNTLKIPYEGQGQGMLRIVLIKDLFKDILPELNKRISLRCDAPSNMQIVFKTDVGQIILDNKVREISLPEKSRKSAIIIETPQNALIRLVTGYYNAESFVRRINNLKVSEKAVKLLNILFPKDIPYTCECDYF